MSPPDDQPPVDASGAAATAPEVSAPTAPPSTPAREAAPPIAPALVPAPPGVYGAKRALMLFFSFWVVQLVALLVLVLCATLFAMKTGAGGRSLVGRLAEPTVLLGAAIAVTAGATLFLLALARRVLRDISPGAPLAPLGWVPAPARSTASAAGQAVGTLVVFALLSRFVPAPTHELGALAQAAMAGGWSRLAWAVLAVLVAPVSEELVFRGVLYTGLARSWRPPVAAVVTTVAFTAFHATEIRGYWPAWLAIGFVGALTLRARVRSGSLVPGIVLHATYNLGLVVVAYAGATRP
jgi:membrane protease YdiL (CAAX protease family)